MRSVSYFFVFMAASVLAPTYLQAQSCPDVTSSYCHDVHNTCMQEAEGKDCDFWTCPSYCEEQERLCMDGDVGTYVTSQLSSSNVAFPPKCGLPQGRNANNANHYAIVYEKTDTWIDSTWEQRYCPYSPNGNPAPTLLPQQNRYEYCYNVVVDYYSCGGYPPASTFPLDSCRY